MCEIDLFKVKTTDFWATYIHIVRFVIITIMAMNGLRTFLRCRLEMSGTTHGLAAVSLTTARQGRHFFV